MHTRFLARVLRILALGLLAAAAARADNAPQPSRDQLAVMAQSLQWQTGTITLKDGLAKINLSDDFRFLNSADAQKVIHDLWGNPPDPQILGMIFPKDKGPLSPDPWAVTVTYEDSGYVKDDDAAKINYTDLLKQMQDEAKSANPERQKEGYPAIDIVGWAQAPRYDPAAHKLYWAKDLRFSDDTRGDVLNYDIRILGRRGVLVLRAIAGMDELPQINAAAPRILAMVDFQPGNTYAEFDPKIDKVAEYGLAGLIAGGALAGAAKLGLFGALIKILIAGWKVVLVAIAAIGTALKKAWSGLTGKRNTPDNLLPPR